MKKKKKKKNATILCHACFDVFRRHVAKKKNEHKVTMKSIRIAPRKTISRRHNYTEIASHSNAVEKLTKQEPFQIV